MRCIFFPLKNGLGKGFYMIYFVIPFAKQLKIINGDKIGYRIIIIRITIIKIIVIGVIAFRKNWEEKIFYQKRYFIDFAIGNFGQNIIDFSWGF